MVTPLNPGDVTFAQHVREMISTVTGESYFGPGQPMAPNAPAGTLPRTFDYPMSVNMLSQPRQEGGQGPSFQLLRQFADGVDIIRLCIETRKRQVTKVPWAIRVKSTGGLIADQKLQSQQSPRVKELTTFFKRPDREHGWMGWLGMVMEEVLVTDALSIWPVYTGEGRASKVVALKPISGATIKPLLDAQGWRPNAPNPAYQQFLKGMAATDFTGGLCASCLSIGSHTGAAGGRARCNPLIYAPMTPRTHKIYGFSPVEQVMSFLVLAAERMTSQIAYYVDGNIPEMIIQTPETWTDEQITRFQNIFDQVAGDTSKKRRVRFIPATGGILQTKEAMLKDNLDEWMARVFCYALNVSPTPFINQLNRSTGETSAQQSKEEGTQNDLEWIQALMNDIIEHTMGYDDVEFTFNLEDEPDKLKQMTINTGYAAAGILKRNEIRETLGKDPLPNDGVDESQTAGPGDQTPEKKKADLQALESKAVDSAVKLFLKAAEDQPAPTALIEAGLKKKY